MASVRRNTRGSGWICSHRDRTGRPRTEHFDKKQDAEDFRVECEKLEKLVTSKIRFHAAGERFLNVLAAKSLDPMTIVQIRQALTGHVYPVLGKRLVNEISADDLRELAVTLGERVAKSYADQIVALARRVLRNAVVNENVFFSPGDELLSVRSKAANANFEGLSHLRPPTPIGTITPEDLPTYDDVRVLLKNSTGLARVIFYLGFLGGLRISEMLGLRRGDISFDGLGNIHVGRIRKRTSLKHKHSENFAAPRKRKDKSGKTDAGERDVEMDPFLKYELEIWMAGLEGDNPDLPLLASKETPMAPYTETAPSRHCRKMQQKLGIGQVVDGKFKTFSIHDLRHTCVSLMVHVGYDISDVSEWIGHADISTTIGDYARVLRDVEDARDLALPPRNNGRPCAAADQVPTDFAAVDDERLRVGKFSNSSAPTGYDSRSTACAGAA